MIENHRATALSAEAEIFGLEFHPALPSPFRREGNGMPARNIETSLFFEKVLG